MAMDIMQGDMAQMAPPPQGGGAGDAASVNKQQLDQLMKVLLQKASASQSSLQKPQLRNSPDSMQKQGMSKMPAATGDPSRDAQNNVNTSLNNIGGLIHNFSAQHKQNQVRDAMSEWQGISNAYEKAQVAAGAPPNGNSEDPEYKKKVMEMMKNDPWVKANLDPANPKSVKRLKNMSKALNFDPLGGDEENVHRQGLLQHFKVQDAFKKMLGARKKMDEHKQGAQPQGQPQGGKPNAQDLQGVLGNIMSQSKVQQPDIKEQTEVAKVGVEKYKAEADMVRAKNSSMDKYDFKQGVGADGKPAWFAFDKVNPNKAQELKVDGQNVGTVDNHSNASVGKPVMVEGKPMGVMGIDGKTGKVRAKNTNDPDWNESDARSFEASNSAYATAEANKMANTRMRAETYVSSRQYPVLDKTGTLRYANANELNARPNDYSPASGGIAAMGKDGIFNDILWNSNNVRSTAAALKGGFSAAERAQFIAALRSSDPHQAVSTWMSSTAGAKFIGNDESKMNYIASVSSLMEQAMALRQIGGFGQGSQDLRDAILRTIPGAGSYSLKMVNKQLDIFEGSLNRIRGGVPKTVATAPITDPNAIPDAN